MYVRPNIHITGEGGLSIYLINMSAQPLCNINKQLPAVASPLAPGRLYPAQALTNYWSDVQIYLPRPGRSHSSRICQPRTESHRRCASMPRNINFMIKSFHPIYAWLGVVILLCFMIIFLHKCSPFTTVELRLKAKHLSVIRYVITSALRSFSLLRTHLLP